VTARFLHAEFFTFTPVAKFFLAVNHRPRVQDDSYGFWRRVRLIPFTRQFIGQSDDKNLLDKLIAESSGILNWLIEGCLLWQKQGLDPTPESVQKATAEYQTDSDPLSQFILEQCAINPQAQVKASALYKSYVSWCEEQGYKEREQMTSTAFGRRMSQKFKKSQNRNGIFYQGLGLEREGFVNSFERNDQKTMFFSISILMWEINWKTLHNP
jgi:putative DNA primase/helicase